MDYCDTTSFPLDYSGECLNSTNESKKEDNDTFSSNLWDIIDFIIFAFKTVDGYIFGNNHFCHIIKEILFGIFSAKTLRNSCEKAPL